MVSKLAILMAFFDLVVEVSETFGIMVIILILCIEHQIINSLTGY